MQDAEYRVSRADKFHRMAMLIAVPAAVLVLCYDSGRGAYALFFWLVAIWFADDLSGLAVSAGGGWISPLKAPQVIRWVGWGCFGWILVSGCMAIKERRERAEDRQHVEPVKEWWKVED